MSASLLGFFGFLAACFAVASSGAFFRPGAWYQDLRKPFWCPPNWLFAPAWTVLYIMIAFAGWRLWRVAGFSGAPLGFGLYGAQLVLNAAWSGLFFGLRRPDLAFAEVLALWLAIAGTIVSFAAVDAAAAWLMAPYLAWVTFAAALNLAIWRLNPGRLARI